MLATKLSTLTDQDGRVLQLGPLLGRGGEGSVHAVVGNAGVVAKVYHQPLTSERAAKISAMIRMASTSLERVCAWPQGLIMEGLQPRGLLMPLVKNRKELHVLHGPKSRKAEFPDAGFDFLVHAALNVARAFAQLHEAGVIVGDVNDRGIMIGADGLVRLIDCDSFQIAFQGRKYLCDVGVPEYTPPELQTGTLTGIIRTPNHDAFGLAVLIFRLLFMGRHPFAGLFRGGHKEIQEAIAEGRYAYASDKARTLMDPPPHMLSVPQGAGPSVAAYFERAFSITVGVRPSAQDWVAGLEALRSDLAKCQFNSAHSYVRSLASCPWCELEQRCGVDLFHFVAAEGATAVPIDVDAVWRALGALKVPDVPSPIPESFLQVPQPQPHTELRSLKDQAVTLRVEAQRARHAASQIAAEASRRANAAARLLTQLSDADPEVLALECRLARLRGPEKQRLGARVLHLLVFALVMLASVTNSQKLLVIPVLVVVAMFGSDLLVAWVRKTMAVQIERRIGQERLTALERDPEARSRLEAMNAEADRAKDEAQRTHDVASAIEQAAAEAEARFSEARDPVVLTADLNLQEAQKNADASQSALAALSGEAATLRAEIQTRLSKVNASRMTLSDLDKSREADLRELRDADRNAQLERFLDQHFVASARIDGISPALLSALVSFGIQTAADVTLADVSNVPGFGKVRTGHMINWRRSIERQFRYVPVQAIDPAQRKAIESKYAAGRLRVARDLVTARTEIERRIGDLASRIPPAKQNADAAVRALVYARAMRRALEID